MAARSAHGPAPGHSRRRAPSADRAAAWDLPRSCGAGASPARRWIVPAPRPAGRKDRCARKACPALAANNCSSAASALVSFTGLPALVRRDAFRIVTAPSPIFTGPAARRCHRRGPAQQGGDPQQQFARLERLGQIIVHAQFQPGDAVGGFAPRRQHQDGNLRSRRAPIWPDPARIRPASSHPGSGGRRPCFSSGRGPRRRPARR